MRWSALHLAGQGGYIKIVETLARAGCDLFQRNIENRTARQVSRGNVALGRIFQKRERL